VQRWGPGATSSLAGTDCPAFTLKMTQHHPLFLQAAGTLRLAGLGPFFLSLTLELARVRRTREHG